MRAEKLTKEHLTIDRSRGAIIKKVKLPDLLPELVKKFEVLNNITKGIDGIDVPKLVDSNVEKGELILEYIPNLIPVSNLIWTDENILHLMRRIGKGLAQLHLNPTMPPKWAKMLPSPFDKFNKQCAYLYLDCTTINIQYHRESDELIFLDWELPLIFGRIGNYGTIYFDLAFFICHLMTLPPFIFKKYKSRVSLIESFLTGYESVTPLDQLYMKKVAKVFYDEKKRLVKGARYLKILKTWRLNMYKEYLKDFA